MKHAPPVEGPPSFWRSRFAVGWLALALVARHMESPSLAMLGTSMKLTLDERQGRGLGARVAMSGRVLGLGLALDEEVVEYEPPRRKTWQTLGRPRVLVIGGHRLGFVVEPVGDGCRVRLWIDYALPPRGVSRWLGRLAGRLYACGCLRQMLGALDPT